MLQSYDKERRYLEKEEYFAAKKREDELYSYLRPWLDGAYSNHLKPDAPNGCEELYKEFLEIAQNTYFTEFMNGCAY